MQNGHHANSLAGIRAESEVDNSLDTVEDSEEVMKDLLFLIHGWSPAPDRSSASDVPIIYQTEGPPPEIIMAGYGC